MEVKQPLKALFTPSFTPILHSFLLIENKKIQVKNTPTPYCIRLLIKKPNSTLIFRFARHIQRHHNVIIYHSKSRQQGDSNNPKDRNIYVHIIRSLGFPLYKFTLINWLEKMLRIKEHYCLPYIIIHREPRKEWGVFHPPDIQTIQQLGLHIHMGYYQSCHYIRPSFITRLQHILSEINIAPSPYTIQPEDIALHFRRGDFIAQPYRHIYHTFKADFYLSALQKHTQQGSIGKVYIFSDDFEAIKEDIALIQEAGYPLILVQKQSNLTDFKLLTQFRRYVLANSTFSWWAALLSKYPSPIIIVPKEPFKIEMPEKSIYPSDWICL